VSDLRIHFALRPVAAIQPWSNDGRPSLSWFGLSDGWYWLEVGDQELFRAADAPAGTPPYADYQVVRLWEDILAIAPAVLDEVPADVAANVRDHESWLAAVERIVADDRLDHELVADGLRWWHERELDSGHFVAAPKLWLWRSGESVDRLWRSSAQPAAAELWRPAAGFGRQSLASFVSELRRFDREFVSAMAERVAALVRDGGRPGVEIDLDQLQREQRDRATWLARALASAPAASDWDRARELLAAARKVGLL
jgi:hypothetical protein